jgi:hypothetical protein
VNGKHDMPRVDAARTNQLTLAAQHTFFGFFAQFVGLTAHHHQLQLTKTEWNKPPCRTGGHTGSASDAGGKRRLAPQNLRGKLPRRTVQIYPVTLVDTVSKHFILK